MGHHEQRRPSQAVTREVMLGCPGRMEPQLLGQLHLLQQIGEHLRIRAALGPRHVVKQGIFHGDPSAISSGNLGADRIPVHDLEPVGAQTESEAIG